MSYHCRRLPLAPILFLLAFVLSPTESFAGSSKGSSFVRAASMRWGVKVHPIPADSRSSRYAPKRQRWPMSPSFPMNDTTSTTQLQASKNKKNDESDKDGDFSDVATPLPFSVVAATVVAFVAFWPLLAFFRDTNDPTSGFDIDMFMALKGIFDASDNNYYSDGMAAYEYGDRILELPPLSPAEKLVGAIFGPP